MRHALRAAALGLVLALALAGSGWAETAIELKKELLPKVRKAEAEGRDLGQAGEEFKAGDEALKQGMQDEALEHFKKAKELMPAE
jgi:hypothetical protein